MVVARLRPGEGGAFRLFASQEALLAFAIIGIAILVGLYNPRFLATRNLADIVLGNAYIAVAAIGMSMVIVSGNIDISVGSLIGVLATISGSLAVAGVPIILVWLPPLVVGVLVMMLQGAVIAYLRIPAIVVTLGMLSILKGGLISVTGGRWITDLPQSFHLADIELFGILPMPVLIMVAATILAALWMRYSASGRAIYATGGNAEAARLCGVSPRGMAVLAHEARSAAPRWLIRHETLLAAILVVALAILGLFNERFLTIDNLLSQGRLMTEVGLLALPMTFIIITGGIDLSVGSIVGLCAIMLGYSWKNLGFPLPLAIG